MSESGQNKSEAPSDRRREEARRKGQVAYSQELTSGLAFFLGILILWLTAGATWQSLQDLLHRELAAISPRPWTPELVQSTMRAAAFSLISLVAPITLTMWSFALLTGFVQTRGLLTLQPLNPDVSRFSPAKGFQRLWSSRSLVKVGQVTLRASVILVIALLASRDELRYVLATNYSSLIEVAMRAGRLSVKVSIIAAILLLVTGVLDFLFEWWRHENELMMTLRELKDERKQEEGDPHLKARIRRVQREISRKQMLREVKTGTVTLRNPTHYAVVLRYERGQMAAPRVVAKGADFLAQRIIELSEEHHVPVLERKALARALYRYVEVGQEIPVTFYQVVAEVLIYVDRLRRGR